MNKIFKIFIVIITISLVLLGYIYYENNQFNNNPLSYKTLTKIKQKEYKLRKLILEKYDIKVNIPIKISSKIKDNLFGLAVYNKGDIQIILNKNRFQESEEYMVDYVLPHEYAHALMFVLNDFSPNNGGHSKKWQKVCLSLEGKKCDRFVKHNDVVMGKMDFIY